jgi:hypothetical protein
LGYFSQTHLVTLVAEKRVATADARAYFIFYEEKKKKKLQTPQIFVSIIFLEKQT